MKKRVGKKSIKKNKKSRGWIFWTPRILSIVFVLFLALFSLDVFDSNLGFLGTLLGLLIHNIPAIILLIILIISWKYEIVGGIAFILAGLLYTTICVVRAIMSSPAAWYMLSWSLIIAGPAFFIGILFLIGWFRKKKAK